MSSPEGYHHTTAERVLPFPLAPDSNEQIHPWYPGEQVSLAGPLHSYAIPDTADSTEHTAPAEPVATDSPKLGHTALSSSVEHARSQDAPVSSSEQTVAADLDAADVSLSGISQYVRELRSITRLSSEAEQAVVERARNGDQEALYQLIESHLPYIMYMAKVYHVYVEHEELIDIVSVANLAVTENAEKSLTKDNPAAYLCGVAKRAIRKYCLYHSRLIPIKSHSMPRIAEAPTVTSMDALREDQLYRHLGSLAQSGTPETDEAPHQQLRQALDQLDDLQRHVVELHHGMDSNAFGFTDIARLLAISRPMAYRRYNRALEQLRELVPMESISKSD